MKSNSHSPSKERERERERKESNSRSKSKSRSIRNSRDRGRDHRSYSSSKSKQSRNKSKNRSTSLDNTGNVLYVTNLSPRMKERHIEEKFGKYGSITNVKIVRDPYTKESRGFCFVYYSNSKDADEAIEALNGYELEGRRIRVEKAKRNKPREQTPGQYLGHYKSRNVRRRSNSFSGDKKKYRRDRSRSNRRHSRSRSRSKRRKYSSRYRSRSRS